MSLGNNMEEALFFAALHNLSMLSIVESARANKEKIGVKFLTFPEGIPFPSTLPDIILANLEVVFGSGKVLVIDFTIGPQVPEASKLWKPPVN